MLPIHDYNRAINAAVIGYFLVLVVLAGNALVGSKLGFFLSLAVMLLCYLTESARAQAVMLPRRVLALAQALLVGLWLAAAACLAQGWYPTALGH
ncbi:hypothetical protein [Bordetella genomosp. 1]|uniref:Uncharacterized protein n=1 Tax=Bordetella genomosp. 1 TaxID=1395607 RepID=A0ABX4EW74_9BORD|nr:hypothetical protein [Bordetella genomosp. 1]OZI58730.1 hypothetical protein CAL27_18790 [Bordetella genomosp. 1]